MSLLSFIKRLPIVWLWLVLVFLASGLIINLFQLLLLPLWFIKKDLFRWANLNVVYLHWCRKYMITRIDLLISDLVITKGFAVRATTIKGQNTFAQMLFFAQVSCDRWSKHAWFITSDRSCKCTRSDCIWCIPFIFNGSLNEAGYIRAVHA